LIISIFYHNFAQVFFDACDTSAEGTCTAIAVKDLRQKYFIFFLHKAHHFSFLPIISKNKQIQAILQNHWDYSYQYFHYAQRPGDSRSAGLTVLRFAFKFQFINLFNACLQKPARIADGASL